MSDNLPRISFPRLSPGTSLPPFSFSPLSSATSSERENLETLDLISKLSAPLSLPTQAAAAEDMPEWVEKLAMDKGAGFVWKVMDQKKISASDISNQHNRFMISKKVIQEKIKPEMTGEEIEAANLISLPRIGGGGQPGGRRRGRVQKGLEVMVYNKSGPGCLLYLTRWNSSESSVLKGPNYKELRRYLASGDLIELWAFRDGADKLCFVIEKKPDLNLSL